MPKVETDDLAGAILKLAESFGVSQAQTAETLEALRANQKPRDINFSDQDYQEKLKRETKVLKRPAFQNTFPVNPSGLTDEEITRLAALAPGKYLGGHVEVTIGGNDAICLWYKNKTVEQRMANERKFASFGVLINTIWAEMHPEPVAV